MVKLPSAKVYSLSVSVSYLGQSPKCVKVATLGPRTLPDLEKSKNIQNYQVYTVYANTNMAGTRSVCPIYMVNLGVARPGPVASNS